MGESTGASLTASRSQWKYPESLSLPFEPLSPSGKPFRDTRVCLGSTEFWGAASLLLERSSRPKLVDETHRTLAFRSTAAWNCRADPRGPAHVEAALGPSKQTAPSSTSTHPGGEGVLIHRPTSFCVLMFLENLGNRTTPTVCSHHTGHTQLVVLTSTAPIMFKDKLTRPPQGRWNSSFHPQLQAKERRRGGRLG